MGYVFNLDDALRYQRWTRSEPGQSAIEIEKELLQRLWSPLASQRVLEVGCGTGIFLDWFARLGHQTTGLDPSPDMLNFARENLPERVALDRGFAEDLPYPDNFFDTVALITTLEFVDNPHRAVKEACRVARSHVLVGSLNLYSPMVWTQRVGSLLRPSVYRHARFYGIWGLRSLFEQVLSGPVPLRWKTCLTLPLNILKYVRFIERNAYFQWNPLGRFVGMRIDLRYTVQTLQEPLLTKVLTRAAPDRCQVMMIRPPKERKRKRPPANERGAPPSPLPPRPRMEASTTPQSL